MHEERRRDHMVDKLLRLWPIAAVIVAGATGYIRMQIQVARIEKVPEQVEILNNRLTVLETQMAFFQTRYRARHEQ